MFDDHWHERVERKINATHDMLRRVLEGEGFIMSQQDEVNAVVAQEQTAVSDIDAKQAAIATALADLEAQISTNPGQPASSLDLSGLHAVAGDLDTAATNVDATATTAATDDPGAPAAPVTPPVTDPTAPVDPTTPPADTTTPPPDASATTPDPAATTPDPAAPVDAAPAAAPTDGSAPTA